MSEAANDYDDLLDGAERRRSQAVADCVRPRSLRQKRHTNPETLIMSSHSCCTVGIAGCLPSTVRESHHRKG